MCVRNGSTQPVVQEDAVTAAVSFLTSFAQKHTFQAGSLKLQASIHSVLLGHEDWVHGVCWVHRSTQHGGRAAGASRASTGKAAAGDAVPVGSLMLVTASMDRTMMLWAAEASSGLWMCEESVGDAGAPRPRMAPVRAWALPAHAWCA